MDRWFSISMKIGVAIKNVIIKGEKKMPNHVTNIVKFNCTEERFNEIAESVRRDESYLGSVDFNKLIPMPKELDICSGSMGMTGLKMYRDYLNKIRDLKRQSTKERIYEEFISRSDDAKEMMELGKKYYDNIVKYGAPTWYEWCCDNWGTKWNAYDCVEANNNELEFCTAWSGVPALIKKMSEMNPDVKILYRWADEDIGSNVGEMTCKAGQILDINLPEQGSKDAYEMSASIMDFDLEDNGFRLSKDGKTYVWVNEYED